MQFERRFSSTTKKSIMSSLIPPFTAEEKKADFISFCIEQYAQQFKLSGTEVINRFSKTGLLEFLYNHYEGLHTQGGEFLVQLLHEMLTDREASK